MDIYREKLIMTYNELLDFHEELLTRIINVGMTGPMSEINKTFEKDDSFQFDKEMFRGTTDQNLNLLLEIHDALEDKMNSFANINKLTQEELDEISDETFEPKIFEYDYDFIPKYNPGQIVNYEDCGKSLIGIISNIPFTFEEREKRGLKTEDLDDTDQVYNIEYIAENGVLQHSHILEKDLEITEDKLPPELIFLNILSLHFSGAKKLDSNLLLSMMQGDYFLRNKKTLHNLDAKWKKLLKL